MSTLYQRIADYYLEAIGRGTLRAGERFPSVRELMRRHEVSLSTALQVCRHLEDQGWLLARPRSGYFVRRAQQALLPPSSEPDVAGPTPQAEYVGMHEHISDILARGGQQPTRVNLAIAIGTPDLYPTAALGRVTQQVLRQHPEVLTTMARRHGHPSLREALARRMLERRVQASSESIIVTHGCTEALNLALRAVAQPGDTVVVESPTFYGFLQLIEALGLRALELPTSPQTGLSVDALAFALAQDAAQPGGPRIKAVLAVPTLHNPLGCTMPDAHKERLVRLCEAHDVALIEDDIYSEMSARDPLPPPAKAWDRSGHVIYCGSLNKVLAPGWRVGWMVAGRWHARVEMLKYTQSRYSAELPQITLARFLDSPAYDRHLRRMRARLQQQREQMADAVARHFPAGTRMALPDGGMLLWVQLPDGVSSVALFEQALAQGIKVAPGSLFSNSERYRHCLRLSCACPMDAAAEEAIRWLGAAVAHLAARASAGAANNGHAALRA